MSRPNAYYPSPERRTGESDASFLIINGPLASFSSLLFSAFCAFSPVFDRFFRLRRAIFDGCLHTAGFAFGGLLEFGLAGILDFPAAEQSDHA